jgi:hypothetical protein
MAADVANERPQNFLLAVLFVIAVLFTAFQEGYFPVLSLSFWLCLGAGFALSFWLALTISTRRLLALILVIFIMEYLKETIGIWSGMWTYHGIRGAYNFGVWAWVVAGLTVFTLSTRMVMRKIRKISPTLSRKGHLVNSLIVLLLFFAIPLSLGNYRDGTGMWFWSFYLVLLAVGLQAAWRMDLAVFSGIVLTAWVVGLPSEYLGSVSSRVWSFTYNPNYPPFFLIIGCWPLEILAQYSLSAFLAKENLDKDTSS